MVERLKKAIDKARAHREQVLTGNLSPLPGPNGQATDLRGPADHGPWAALPEIELDAAHLRRMRVVSYQKSESSHVVFDVLRTRLLKVFKDNGWSRLAITSPTKGCGKTFVSANLALSLARQADFRAVLIDMDLMAPGLGRTLGVDVSNSIEPFLTGQTAPAAFLQRVRQNLALGLNGRPVRNSAELIHDESTGQALARMCDLYQPDVVIYDLPPMLISDDAIGFLPHVDCILLIAAAGQTEPAELEECERLLGDGTNLLGVLLNKCDAKSSDRYPFGYHG